MRKLIAIIFIITFLITTYFIPLTSVYADVNWGDNNEIIVNDNAKILGRKIAIMECIPDLLNTGVSSIDISDTEDVDELVDYIWGKVNDTIDYITNGDGLHDLSLSLQGEYLNNLNKYVNYIDNRGQFFANLIQDPSTTLLKSYFLSRTLGKVEYKPSYTSLGALSTISNFNDSSSQPDIPTDLQPLVANIGGYAMGSFDFRQNQLYNSGWGNSNKIYVTGDFSVYSQDGQITSPTSSFTKTGYWKISNYGTVRLNSDGNGGYNASYINFSQKYFDGTNLNMASNGLLGDFMYSVPVLQFRSLTNNNSSIVGTQNFSSITIAINYLNTHFRHINLYVDDVLWAGQLPTFPNINLDGKLVISGEDNPASYNIPNGTTIDYDALYNTIYNAIHNNLPISQSNITYYDSHDNIYSPTIINNYSSDGDGDEDDFIDSLLTWAVIPEFDTALLVPLEQPLLNGEKIFITSVQVFPHDILMVIGAAFVLILFAAFINRLIE